MKNNNDKEFKPTVNWFLNKKSLQKREGENGEFYSARIFKGVKLPDGKDISGYTYTFNVDKLKEIKVYETSPDFIKDDKFRENNGVIYFNEDTNIKLTEPYDKNNPDKELSTITVDASTLCTAIRNREKQNKDSEHTKEAKNEKGTKERLTKRAVEASNAKSSSKEVKSITKETCK